MVRNSFTKVMSVTLSSAFIFSSVITPATAAPALSSISQAESALVKRFEIPANLGSIVDVHVKDSAPLVIHIQDLHANYGVQTKISQILAVLDEKLGAGNYKVAVEGAEGPIVVSQLGKISDKKFKTRVFGNLMEAAELTGAQYYAMVEGKTDLLWGVEDRRYHHANISLFQSTYKGKQDFAKALNTLQTELEPLKKQQYTSLMKKLDRRAASFANGKTDMDDYTYFLARQGRKRGIDIAGKYPEIAKWTGMTAASGYPDTDKLMTEQADLVVELQGSYAKTHTQKNLAAAIGELDLLKRLTTEQLTTQEVREVAPKISEIAGHAKQLLDSSGVSYNQKGLADLISASLDYYAVALLRDQFLAENSLKLMKTSKLQNVVLIAGGFHTPGISKILHQKGASYITIAPNVDSHTDADQKLYISRLMGRHVNPTEFVARGTMLGIDANASGAVAAVAGVTSADAAALGMVSDAALANAVSQSAGKAEQGVDVGLADYFKNATGGVTTVRLDIPTSSTPADLVDALIAKFPALSSQRSILLTSIVSGSDTIGADAQVGRKVDVIPNTGGGSPDASNGGFAAVNTLEDQAAKTAAEAFVNQLQEIAIANGGPLRVGINGFGRIGRMVFRAAHDNPFVQVVAINDLVPEETNAHLLKYDTNAGEFKGTVRSEPGWIIVDGRRIYAYKQIDPALIPWGPMGVNVVIEGTGAFTDAEKAKAHLQGGAQFIVISAPATNEDKTIVMGINDDELDLTKHVVVSNASCTTNCLAPIAEVLDRKFGIKKGLVTTVHAYTNDQNVQDGPHKDLRRARAAAGNIIPTTTGVTKAIALVLPKLKGKLNGFSMRVPVGNVSAVDLKVDLEIPATKEEINAAFREAALEPRYKGILTIVDAPLVSSDFKGNPHSSIVDSEFTMEVDGLSQVMSWYDNEWGYSKRVVDLLVLYARKLVAFFTGRVVPLQARSLDGYLDQIMNSDVIKIHEPTSDLIADNPVEKFMSNPHYTNESSKLMDNLRAFFNFGSLKGTGKLLILPIDQGLEHSPVRSFGVNPPAASKFWQTRLARLTGMSGYAAPYGTIKEQAPTANGLPMIAKINNSVDTIGNLKESQHSALMGDIRELAEIGAKAIGWTLYGGSAPRSWDAQMQEVRGIVQEGRQYGLPSFGWSYPRGLDFRYDLNKTGGEQDETSLDTAIAAMRIAIDAGAHVIKVKPPRNKFRNKSFEKWLKAQPWFLDVSTGKPKYNLDLLEDRIALLMLFSDGLPVVFSGGETKPSDADVLDEDARIILGGGTGLIKGRNNFQRSEEGSTDLSLHDEAMLIAKTQRHFDRNDVEGFKKYAFEVVLPVLREQQRELAQQLAESEKAAAAGTDLDIVAAKMDRSFKAEKPQLLANHEKLYRSGKLADTGKFIIAPFVPGAENPEGVSAFVVPLEDAPNLKDENELKDQALIAKITPTPYVKGTIPADYAFNPAILSQIQGLPSYGVTAVGYTLNPVLSPSYNAQITELREIIKAAKAVGLPTYVWIQATGDHGNAVDILTTGTQIALEAGAHLVIGQEPSNVVRSKKDAEAIEKIRGQFSNNDRGGAAKIAKYFGAWGGTRDLALEFEGELYPGQTDSMIAAGIDGFSFAKTPSKSDIEQLVVLFNHRSGPATDAQASLPVREMFLGFVNVVLVGVAAIFLTQWAALLIPLAALSGVEGVAGFLRNRAVGMPLWQSLTTPGALSNEPIAHIPGVLRPHEIGSHGIGLGEVPTFFFKHVVALAAAIAHIIKTVLRIGDDAKIAQMQNIVDAINNLAEMSPLRIATAPSRYAKDAFNAYQLKEAELAEERIALSKKYAGMAA